MPAAKHILFVNEFFHPDYCASAMVLEDRLPRIARLRPDWGITVIAGNRAWDDPAVVYPAEEAFQGVRVVRVSRPAVGGRSLLRRAIGFAAFGRNAIRAAMRLPRVDLVVGTTAPPQGGLIARKIARKRGCSYVYAVLDLYPDIATSLNKVAAGSFVYRRWLAADSRVMRDAVRVVTVSTPITERIARTRGISSEKLATIHDGFDPARLERCDRPNTFRQQFNPAGRFTVQYAGNMGLSHPFEAILDACEGLGESDPDVLFQFVGDGPGRAYVQQRVARPPSARQKRLAPPLSAGPALSRRETDRERVTPANPPGEVEPPNAQLIGYQPAERLGEVLDAADVCLVSQQPDLFDQALPYKIYGILAAGKPTVFLGSDRSEIATWLTGGGAGTVVHPSAPEPLVAHLRRLRHDPQLVAAQGRAARRLFEERFHADAAAEKWTRLLAAVL